MGCVLAVNLTVSNYKRLLRSNAAFSVLFLFSGVCFALDIAEITDSR